jgi:tRNA pseudouridine38-40 synthase
MRRVAVKIAYLGDPFAGSQIQPGFRTVEGDVLSDLKRISDLDDNGINLKCASRTDRGVNALGNVIVFNTPFEDNVTLLRALNAVSTDIFYRQIADVDENFNPRHAAERVYRYVLPAEGMDVSAAKECASLFEGTHDFARFCKHDGRSTVMYMRSAKVSCDGGVFVIEFRSKYFLWNQIRRIAAAISSVGRGTSCVGDVERALNGEDISFGTARADALTLADVEYDCPKFCVSVMPEAERGSRAEEERFKTDLRMRFFDSL